MNTKEFHSLVKQHVEKQVAAKLKEALQALGAHACGGVLPLAQVKRGRPAKVAKPAAVATAPLAKKRGRPPKVQNLPGVPSAQV